MFESCDAMPQDLETSLAGSDVLGVFTKFPEPGQVKSRLAADADPKWAALVAEAFLRDLTQRLAHLPVSRFLVYSPAASRQWFIDLADDRYQLHLQAEGDLGDRMAEFVQTQFARGARKIALLGMDSPTLPVAYLARAFELLDRVDVVLGPAMDGGYYLFGCRTFTPAIWNRVEWSGPQVLAATIANLRRLRMTCMLLPPWYDVDTLDDFHMLVGHLMGLREAGKAPELPALESLLARDSRYGSLRGEKPAVACPDRR